jgi:hypothetical protein
MRVAYLSQIFFIFDVRVHVCYCSVAVFVLAYWKFCFINTIVVSQDLTDCVVFLYCSSISLYLLLLLLIICQRV